MVVDAELGMPLELGKNDDAYWNSDFSGLLNTPLECRSSVGAVIAPDASNRPVLDEEDLELLREPAGGTSASATGQLNTTGHLTLATNLPQADRKKQEVSWLRRTEYLATDTAAQRAVEPRCALLLR